MPTVEIPFDPRPGQYEVLKSLRRFNVLVCHRRWGKTVLCINKLIASALRNTQERPRYAYIAPLYRQSKQVAWDYLKHYTQVIPGTTFNESELRVDLPNGARIQLFGADNPDALRGIYLDGVVLDEYAQMSPKAWSEVIRPALSDRQGWAIFIGTPKGHNAFYELYEYAKTQEDWFAGMYRASETKVISETELRAAKGTMDPDEYAQEFECSFEASIKGAYYADQVKHAKEQNRICGINWEKNLLVSTAWDIGFHDSTVIVFYQTIGKEIRIIDVEEHVGEAPEFYATLLKQKGYKYDTHNLPHDGDVKRIDNGGKSLKSQLEQLGVFPIHIAPHVSVDAGIASVRSLFSRFYIDNSNERMRYFIECITQYHKEWDEDRKTFKPKPDHDWASHAADALRYLAVSFLEEYPAEESEDVTELIGGRLG